MKPAEVIEQLRKEYTSNKLGFEMQASVYLAGETPDKKQLRQEIANHLTGTEQPKRKCTQSYVADLIKASLEQLAMF